MTNNVLILLVATVALLSDTMDFQVTLSIVLFSLVGNSLGQLRCYTCGFSSVDTDQSCLTITNSTLSSNCPYKYCTILRQEFVDPRGAIASFTRGCDDSPDFLNHEVTDSTFRTIYRACTNDLCNIGDGIQSVVGGSLSPTPEYTGSNLLVPGTKISGASATAGSFVLIILTNVIGIWMN